MKVIGFLSLLLSFSLSSCDGDSGRSIGAPEIYPPVKNSTPAGLASTTLRLDGAASPQTAIQVLKGRLFSPGPTDFTYRLQKIDERMAELNSRAEDSERKCLNEEATLWADSPTLPNGEVFPMYFQCQEALNETSQLAFGFHEDNFYLMERGTTGSDSEWIIVYAKANAAGTEVEFWQTTIADEVAGGVTTQSYGYTHVSANETTGSLEFTHGGNTGGSGLACGVQMHSSADYIYGSGLFASPNSAEPEDCSGTNRASETVCVSAADLTTADSTNCSTLATFSLKPITNAITELEGGYATAEKVAAAAVSGYTEFND